MNGCRSSIFRSSSSRRSSKSAAVCCTAVLKSRSRSSTVLATPRAAYTLPAWTASTRVFSDCWTALRQPKTPSVTVATSSNTGATSPRANSGRRARNRSRRFNASRTAWALGNRRDGSASRQRSTISESARSTPGTRRISVRRPCIHIARRYSASRFSSPSIW